MAAIDTLFHFRSRSTTSIKPENSTASCSAVPKAARSTAASITTSSGITSSRISIRMRSSARTPKKLRQGGGTPVRHFGVVMPLEKFEQAEKKLKAAGVDFILQPEVRQEGTVREQKLMTCRDGCGNAVEFKGLQNITDVYAGG